MNVDLLSCIIGRLFSLDYSSLLSVCDCYANHIVVRYGYRILVGAWKTADPSVLVGKLASYLLPWVISHTSFSFYGWDQSLDVKSKTDKPFNVRLPWFALLNSLPCAEQDWFHPLSKKLQPWFEDCVTTVIVTSVADVWVNSGGSYSTCTFGSPTVLSHISILLVNINGAFSDLLRTYICRDCT